MHCHQNHAMLVLCQPISNNPIGQAGTRELKKGANGLTKDFSNCLLFHPLPIWPVLLFIGSFNCILMAVHGFDQHQPFEMWFNLWLTEHQHSLFLFSQHGSFSQVHSFLNVFNCKQCLPPNAWTISTMQGNEKSFVRPLAPFLKIQFTNLRLLLLAWKRIFSIGFWWQCMVLTNHLGDCIAFNYQPFEMWFNLCLEKHSLFFTSRPRSSDWLLVKKSQAKSEMHCGRPIAWNTCSEHVCWRLRGSSCEPCWNNFGLFFHVFLKLVMRMIWISRAGLGFVYLFYVIRFWWISDLWLPFRVPSFEELWPLFGSKHKVFSVELFTQTSKAARRSVTKAKSQLSDEV